MKLATVRVIDVVEHVAKDITVIEAVIAVSENAKAVDDDIFRCGKGLPAVRGICPSKELSII